MKDFFKLFGIIAVVAVIGFAACKEPEKKKTESPEADVNPGTPPVVNVALLGEGDGEDDEKVFSLDADDIDNPVPVATIAVSHPAPIKDWTIQVQPIRAPRQEGEQAAAPARERPAGQEGERPAGQQRQDRGAFFELKGEGDPPAEWKWNGKSSREPRTRQDGTTTPVARVQSATDYEYTITVNDIFGNSTEEKGTLKVGVLVTKDDDGNYRIVVPSIIFAGMYGDFSKVREEYENGEQIERSNNRILRLVARALNRFPDYKVIIEGHSNPGAAPGTQARENEERNTLIPVSKWRADLVLEWLVKNGNVDRARLTAVGRGGQRPLVPIDADEEEKANNRRVEFILER